MIMVVPGQGMGYSGSAWTYVGSPGFASNPGTGNYFTSYNNNGYVVFNDSSIYKLSVMWNPL